MNKWNRKAGTGQNDRTETNEEQERQKWDDADHRWKASPPPPSKGELSPRCAECECDLKGAYTC